MLCSNFANPDAPRQALVRIRSALRHRGIDRAAAVAALAGILVGVCVALLAALRGVAA